MAPEQVFGLTAVDVAFPATTPGGSDAAPVATSALPDIPTATHGTNLTEPPPPSPSPPPLAAFTTPSAAAVAAVAAATPAPATFVGHLAPASLSAPAALGRAPLKPLTPMAPLQPPPLSPPPPPQQPPPPPGPASPSRSLEALPTASRRLPPIASGNGNGSTSGAAPQPSGGGGGGGGASPAAAGFSSERDLALSTPLSRIVTPAAGASNSDQRNFDGRELHELVKVSWQDYSDVARVQHIIHIGLSSNTTEASMAEAMMQIREASLHNPLFSLTPAIMQLVREQLLSRNRLLRPAAAYAFAGYAANSRFGRGLMTLNAEVLLPRLNAMLRCKVDSMDARYASLALLTASMHPDHKEVVGRSGSIPLLITLVRQNIGRSSPTPPSHGENIEHIINMYGTERSSTASSVSNSFRPDSSEEAARVDAAAAAAANHHNHLHPGHGGADGGFLLHPHSPPLPGYTPPMFSRLGLPGSPLHGGVHFGHLAGFGGGGVAGGGRVSGRVSGGVGELPTSPTKGAYLLHVKPAAAHAVAALVNLAELAVNRQRMRDAGIAGVLEDVLLSRNDNIIKERCRLLVDLFQMDSTRFKEATAASEMSTVAAVSHAVVNFIQRGKEAKAAVAAAAAAGNGSPLSATAAAAASGSIGLGGSLSNGPLDPHHHQQHHPQQRMRTSSTMGGVVGSAGLRGTLTWTLARQLERGDEEGDRKAGTVTIRQRASASRSVSRLPSQAVARAQSNVRRTTQGTSAAGGEPASPPQGTAGAASTAASTTSAASAPVSPAAVAALRRVSGSSGGSNVSGGSGGAAP